MEQVEGVNSQSEAALSGRGGKLSGEVWAELEMCFLGE